MLVDKIIADIEANEKLASQATPDPRAAVETQLSEALGRTLDKVAAQAAPTAGDPSRDLFKLAEEISNSEKQGEVQQAAICGRAFAHAAINEFSAYDHAAKVAAAQTVLQPVVGYAEQAVKIAASDDELMKAAELGYRDAAIRVQQEAQLQGQNKEAQMETKLASVNLDDNVLEKMAEVGYTQTQEKIAVEQYQQGYTAALSEVRDRAAEEFIKGAAEVDALVQLSQQG
jgi:hypothetical protein